MEPMSADEYVDEEGMTCPFCRADILDSGEDIVDEGTALHRRVTCPKCGKVWAEIYRLVDFWVEEK
jgi:transcriptional regulator NrdR family protein